MMLSQLAKVNLEWFLAINNLAEKFKALDWLGVFFAKYLLYIFLISLFFFFLYSFLRKKYRELAYLIVFSATLARGVIVPIFHWVFPYPRPFVKGDVHLLLHHAATNSFPSGHAIFLFAVSFTIFLYAFEKGLSKKEKSSFFWVGVVSLALSSLCGIARVFCGIHWPFDIIGGVVFGIFSALLSYWLMRKIILV